MTLKQINLSLFKAGFRVTRGVQRGSKIWFEEWERAQGGWCLIGGTGSSSIRTLMRHYRNAARRGFLQ